MYNSHSINIYSSFSLLKLMHVLIVVFIVFPRSTIILTSTKIGLDTTLLASFLDEKESFEKTKNGNFAKIDGRLAREELIEDLIEFLFSRKVAAGLERPRASRSWPRRSRCQRQVNRATVPNRHRALNDARPVYTPRRRATTPMKFA